MVYMEGLVPSSGKTSLLSVVEKKLKHKLIIHGYMKGMVCMPF